MSPRLYMCFSLLLTSTVKILTVKTPTTCQNLWQNISVDPESAIVNEGKLFQDLQVALEAVAKAEGCFNVSVAAGNYTLKEFMIINSNVILSGDNSGHPVCVVVEVDRDFSNAPSPPYALLFQNVTYVEIAGIQFERSPGILGFEYVTKVVIKDSTFR